MAGDWIKMRADLRTHPKVVRISSALHADRLRVVGGLHAVWCLFDAHSTDGSLEGYTLEAVDDLIGWPGFSSTMSAVGWLEDDGAGGLRLPEFDTHNGASAKRRAQEADRKRREREEAAQAEEAVRKASAGDADKKRTRGDKRRGKKHPPPPPGGVAFPGFATFWAAYPSNDRKVAKRQCFDKWVGRGLESIADRVVAHVTAMALTDRWKEQGGRFIPAPLVYLNQDRWEAPTSSVDLGEWWETRGACEKRAAEFGLPKWTEVEPFTDYSARVRKAVAGQVVSA